MKNINVNFELCSGYATQPKTAIEKVDDIIDKIGNSLSSPYYASKALLEYRKELLAIVGELEAQIKQAPSKQVYVVLACENQGDYTEGRYYTSAQNSSEIVGIYDDEGVANEIYERLVKKEQECWLLDAHDEDELDSRYFRVIPVEMNKLLSPDFYAEKTEGPER